MNHPIHGSTNKTENIDYVRSCAFKLFAGEGINKVSMAQVAKETKYGIATVYRYFKTKKQLVIDIEAYKLSGIIEKIEKGFDEFFVNKTALEGIDYLLKWFAYLYTEEKDWLKFDSEFDGYVKQECDDKNMLISYYECVKRLKVLLNRVYDKAKSDHSMKLEKSKNQMFYHMVYSMLSISERLAKGVLFYVNNTEEALELIDLQREMLINTYRG